MYGASSLIDVDASSLSDRPAVAPYGGPLAKLSELARDEKMNDTREVLLEMEAMISELWEFVNETKRIRSMDRARASVRRFGRVFVESVIEYVWRERPAVSRTILKRALLSMDEVEERAAKDGLASGFESFVDLVGYDRDAHSEALETMESGRAMRILPDVRRAVPRQGRHEDPCRLLAPDGGFLAKLADVGLRARAYELADVLDVMQRERDDAILKDRLLW